MSDSWESVAEDLAKKPAIAPQAESPGIWERVASAMKSPVSNMVAPGIGALPGFLGGVKDAAVGGATAAYHALTDPASEADKVGGVNLPYVPTVLNRLLVRPQLAQYDQAKAMGETAPWSKERVLKGIHTVASVVPVVGPVIGAMADRASSGDIEGAAGMGAAAYALGKAGEAAPEAFSKIGEGLKKAPAAIADTFKPEPVITFLRGMGSTDPTARTWIPKLMDELKASGDVSTVDEARAAIQKRLDTYNPVVEKILEPSKDVVIPGSRAEHIQARIDAIPEKVRLDNPAKYKTMVQDIQDSVGQGKDYTIGELDELRKSYERSVKHNQSMSASMAADESTAAMDRASMRFAIDKFYGALDDVAGTGADVQELKSRIGAMLKGDEALAKRTNRAAIQGGQSMPAQIVEGLGHVMRSGKYAENLGSGVMSNINSDISSAMRRWERTPSQINAPLGRPQLALPPPSGQFYIDPSAGSLYGNGAEQQAQGLIRNGESTATGLPARNVTPAPDTGQRALNPAPLTPTRLERSSGQVFTMPERAQGPQRTAVEGTTLSQKQLTEGPNERTFQMPANTPPPLRPMVAGATTGQPALPAGRILVTPAPPDVSRLTIYDAAKQVARDPKTGKMFKYFTADQGAEVPAGTKIIPLERPTGKFTK